MVRHGPYPDVEIRSLGLEWDAQARQLLRRALRDAWPAVQRFGWSISSLCELEPDDADVGYTSEDSTLFVKVRNPKTGEFFSYGFILATTLHELSHLSVLGHGKAFYRCLEQVLRLCAAEPHLRAEACSHVRAEILNAVCDNDARRAKAVLAVWPEAVMCKRPDVADGQLPLEYAAHHGRVAITKLLLEARADVMATGGAEGNVLPVERAAARGNARTAKVLMCACSDASLHAGDGSSAASHAVQQVNARTPDPDLRPVLEGGRDLGPRKRSRRRHTGARVQRTTSLPALTPSRHQGQMSALPGPRAASSCPARIDGDLPWPGRRRTVLSGSLAL